MNRDFVLLVTFFAMFGLEQQAVAQLLEDRTPPVIADVVDVKGEEDFTPVELGDWRAVQLGQDLAAGDLLRTGAFGGLGVAFEDRTYVRLHANTRMTVSDPGGRDAPRRFQLDLGRMWSRASRPDAGVIVETPSATAAVRGTDWYMEVSEDGASRLVVLDGEVRFFNAQGALSVGAGASAIARPGQPPEFELLIEAKDRPRWALSPRSEWLTYMPGSPVVDEASASMAPVWRALVQGQPRQASGQLPQDVSKSETQLIAAWIAVSRRNPQAAEALLAELDLAQLSDNQQRLAAALGIGVAIDLAHFDDALARADAYNTEHGADLPLFALRAQMEALGGRYDAARELAENAARTVPTDWRQHLLMGQIALLQGDDPVMGEQTSRAIELAPDNALAWHWRGIYLAAAGGVDANDVMGAFQQAVELNPELVASHVWIAQLSWASGQSKAALKSFDTALALDPLEPYALAGKALVHLHNDRLDLADALLASHEGADLELHPAMQAAYALRSLLKGEPDQAARAMGRVVAANPDRPGVAMDHSVSLWETGRRDVAMDVIENAARLDPDNPIISWFAAAMSQDQYQVDKAIDYARKAWDAKRRNATAGLVQIPASQNGRLDIGGSFQFAGLPAQGAYYSSLSRHQADANSAFAYAQLYPSALARQSSTSIGLLLDPLAVTYPNRFATFYRTPHLQQTLGVSGVLGSDQVSGLQINSDSQAFIRTSERAISLASDLSIGINDGPEENDDIQSLLGTLRAGTVKDGRHGLVGRLTIDHRDRQLPGSFGVYDLDDTEETTSLVADLGYVLSQSYTDKWMFRVTGGHSDRNFDNPSAFGGSLGPIDYGLAISLGLDTALSFAGRELYDTIFSDSETVLLVADSPTQDITTERVGEALVDLQDDLDPVRAIDAENDLISVQSRRVFSTDNFDMSLGLEYGLSEASARTSQFLLNIVSGGLILDAITSETTPFVVGDAMLQDSDFASRNQSLQGHVFGNWSKGRYSVEAGVFPTWRNSWLRSRAGDNVLTLEEDETDLDWRFGLALNGYANQLRIVTMRTRLLPGVDTIAPLDVLGLMPVQDLGFTASQIDSGIIRYDGELGDGLFLHASAEYQDLTDVSAGLFGERIEQAAFFESDASLLRLGGGVDWRLSERLAASGFYSWSDGEIDGGANDGKVLPLSPEHAANIGLTYIDPRFFRVSARLSYAGERFADGANLVELDSAIVASVGLIMETRDKSWLFNADAQTVASDDNPTALGQAATEHRLSLGLSRRW